MTRVRVEQDVRDYMHEHPGVNVSPAEINAATGHHRTSVSGALLRMSRRPGEHITVEARGAFRYGKQGKPETISLLPLKALLEVVGSCEAGQLARDEDGRVWVLRAPK
jgi:hypothetical protein